MTAAFALDVDVEPLKRGFQQLVAMGARPEPMHDEIGGAMVQRTQERFEHGQAPGGAAWKPSLRAQKTGGKTLIDTARLMQSQTHRVDATGVEWGTNVAYAGIHQTGGTILRKPRTQTLAFDKDGGFLSRAKAKRRRAGAIKIAIANIGASSTAITARPFVGFDDVDRRIVGDIVVRHFTDALEGGGTA